MLFPPIEPYNRFYLDVDKLHRFYVEECGNPKGIPTVFIHGGLELDAMNAIADTLKMDRRH